MLLERVQRRLAAEAGPHHASLRKLPHTRHLTQGLATALEVRSRIVGMASTRELAVVVNNVQVRLRDMRLQAQAPCMHVQQAAQFDQLEPWIKGPVQASRLVALVSPPPPPPMVPMNV